MYLHALGVATFTTAVFWFMDRSVRKKNAPNSPIPILCKENVWLLLFIFFLAFVFYIYYGPKTSAETVKNQRSAVEVKEISENVGWALILGPVKNNEVTGMREVMITLDSNRPAERKFYRFAQYIPASDKSEPDIRKTEKGYEAYVICVKTSGELPATHLFVIRQRKVKEGAIGIDPLTEGFRERNNR